MATAAENEKLVRDFFIALSTGELDRIRPYLSDKTVWQVASVTLPGEHHNVGEAIITDFLAPVRGLFAEGDPKVHVDFVVANESAVMCETRGVGTLADGKPYDNQYAWRFSIEDGKLGSSQNLFLSVR